MPKVAITKSESPVKNKNSFEFNSKSLILFGIILAIALVFVVLSSQNTEAKTITVDDSGGADYEKIQDAVDNATNGDVIRVLKGIYKENVLISKPITLIGNNPENTIIYGGIENGKDNHSFKKEIDYVIKITANYVNISNLKVISNNSKWVNWQCDGVKLFETDFVTIENVNASENHFGILLISSNNNFLNNNYCSNYYGGIRLGYSENNYIKNNTCNSNNYEGIQLSYSSNNNIENNTCNFNSKKSYGTAGIALTYECYNNILINNVCNYNYFYGIRIQKSSKNNTLENNVCNFNKGEYYLNMGHGLGISVDGDYNRILNSTFNSNFEVGIAVSGNNNKIENCVIKNNVKGLYFGGSKNIIYDCVISGNENGFYLIGTNSTIDKCIISNNKNGIYLCSQWNIIQNCNISDNEMGIYIHGGKNNTVNKNNIFYNEIGINIEFRHEESMIPEIPPRDIISENNLIRYNNIYKNRKYGINGENNFGYRINAQNNWWGDASGPYHPINNTNGKGDNVTDCIDFSNWLFTNDFVNNNYQEEDKQEDKDNHEEKEKHQILPFIFIIFFFILLILLFTVNLWCGAIEKRKREKVKAKKVKESKEGEEKNAKDKQKIEE